MGSAKMSLFQRGPRNVKSSLEPAVRLHYGPEFDKVLEGQELIQNWAAQKINPENRNHVLKAALLLTALRNGTFVEPLVGEMSENSFNALHDNREAAQGIARTFLVHPIPQIRLEAVKTLSLHSAQLSNRRALEEILARSRFPEKNPLVRESAWAALINGSMVVDLEAAVPAEIELDAMIGAAAKKRLKLLIKRVTLAKTGE